MKKEYEQAYKEDQIVYFRNAIGRANLREKHRQALLTDKRESVGADYPRPLWTQPKKQKEKLSLKSLVRSLLI